MDVPQLRQALMKADPDGLRLFMDRCPDPVFVLRGAPIVYANDALVSMLGYPREELLAQNPRESFVHPDDRTLLAQNLATREEMLNEVRWLRKDGTALNVEGVGVNATFEGAPARIVVTRDVTARRRAQAELLLADRMMSLGTLAAGIAHELNNPLSAVLANLAFIEQTLGAGANREMLETLRDSRQAAERMARIIRGMKTFSRASEEHLAVLEVAPVVDAAINLTANEILPRARLVKDYAATPLIEADEGRLAQVFVNLLINATQAIPEGDVERNEIRVVLRTEPSLVVIEVRDTGAGIPPESLGRVFDPFYTTKPVGV